MPGVNATYGPGTPLKIGIDHIWRGKDRTNGFLMRNVDGRVPALKQSFSRVDIGAANVLIAAGAVPYGNGLWRDTSALDVDPGVVKTEAPATGRLVGIAEFNQGWQTGHPVQGWGVPQFGRADMICKGYVGYKVAKAVGATPADYLMYLQGDATKDIPAVRTLYVDWMAEISGAGSGSRLALFFDNASGFPVIQAAAVTNGYPSAVPAGLTFAGFCDDVIEPENEVVFVSLGY